MSVHTQAGIETLAALVEQLDRCLAYADAEQDFVLAALISAAREEALAKLSPAAVAE